MPLLLAGLLPPPQRAFIKPSTEDIATEATGTQIASNNGRKSPRNRRPRPAHPILPKPPELPEDNIFTHFQKEADRKDGASCVFLLWGSTDSERFPTWAIDVPIADSKSEDEIFTSLAKQYAEELGFWRRYLTFRKFSRLRPVTFRLISRSSAKFLVFTEPLDLLKCHKIYSQRREKAGTIIGSITHIDYGPYPEECYRDSSGEWEHCNSDCPWNSSSGLDDGVCPFLEWETSNDWLNWIETAPFLSSYFRNPAGARSQDILNGFDGHCFIHKYRKIFLPPEPPRLQQPRPQNRYVELDGLYVETMWDPARFFSIFLGILLCVVAGGKLYWGTWEIVFGAGSFFIALPMLALTLLSHYEL